eukprot:TRINITY_DN2871_c1_g3_i3.p1 TRINITY_DN2871_c1_g3~~TRINITY_DN2871_c1_g3_i3.p1  ORF type:complete len:327 (+),score=78.35 TRINITY_DN2871_c1_g3_i3:73-1053(+)
MSDKQRSYFTEAGPFKLGFYFLSLLLMVGFAVVAVVEFFWAPECSAAVINLKYPNPEYARKPCDWVRHPQLLYLNQMECEWARRLLVAGLLGAVIGFERRSPDRPAGIRTMVTVSIGAALFTLDSMFAFMSGPMEWDSSRVSAALPSGVGFLGAAVIWKQTTDDGRQNINGVTTAASVWLSAAVGTAAGGGLYVSALFTVLITINLLRFGPRMDRKEEEEEAEEEGEAIAMEVDAVPALGQSQGPPPLAAGDGAGDPATEQPGAAPAIPSEQSALWEAYRQQGYGSLTPGPPRRQVSFGAGGRSESYYAGSRVGRTPKPRVAHFAS